MVPPAEPANIPFLFILGMAGRGSWALQPFGGRYHKALQVAQNCFHKALVDQICTRMIADCRGSDVKTMDIMG